MTNAQHIATTTLNQLGGARFVAMTGAKNLVHGENGELTMKVGRNPKGVTHVKIELNSMDLYNVTFYKIAKTDVKVICEVENVYNANLRNCFETNTNLLTSI